jgi:hypothetical protein
MSRKSPGSHVISPDEPIKGFSPELESYFEQLHRLQCNSLLIPESIVSISLFCLQMKTLYYPMRELLEDDFGISKFAAEQLPIPAISDTLKLLHFWEEDSQGEAEYGARLGSQEASSFLNSSDCWKQYRWNIFEADRMLKITRNRIEPTQPEKSGYRFPWLDQPHLRFDLA